MCCRSACPLFQGAAALTTLQDSPRHKVNPLLTSLAQSANGPPVRKPTLREIKTPPALAAFGAFFVPEPLGACLVLAAAIWWLCRKPFGGASSEILPQAPEPDAGRGAYAQAAAMPADVPKTSAAAPAGG
jgi:hypothetical protein